MGSTSSSGSDWEGHWFDPVAFTEKWLEEEWPGKRPEELRRYIQALERREGKT